MDLGNLPLAVVKYISYFHFPILFAWYYPLSKEVVTVSGGCRNL